MSILLLLMVLGVDEGTVPNANRSAPHEAAVAKEDGGKQEPLPRRTSGEVRLELSRLLAEERAADTLEARRPVILQMTRLYCELAADPRLPDHETLEGHRVKLRSRLIDLRDEMKRRAAIAKKSQRGPKPDTSGGTATVAAGGGSVEDNASQLIALIESTIAPETWENQGGPGVIRYYGMVHALVVRATADVHGDLSGLVDGIRAAGR